MFLSVLSNLLRKRQNKELIFTFIYFNNYFIRSYEKRMKEVDNNNNFDNVDNKNIDNTKFSVVNNKIVENDKKSDIEKDFEKDVDVEKDDDKPEWYEAHKIAI